MENAGLTESVLLSYNDVELRWISLENWTYTTGFEMTTKDIQHSTVVLTFHGLDTLAEIYLNDVHIGTANNMFVRYRFNIRDNLVNVRYFRFDTSSILILSL